MKLITSFIARATWSRALPGLAIAAVLSGCAHQANDAKPTAPPSTTAYEESEWAKQAPERAARVAARCDKLLALEKEGQVRRFSNPYQLRSVKGAQVLNESLTGCHALRRMNSQIVAAEGQLAQPGSASAPTPLAP